MNDEAEFGLKRKGCILLASITKRLYVSIESSLFIRSTILRNDETGRALVAVVVVLLRLVRWKIYGTSRVWLASGREK